MTLAVFSLTLWATSTKVMPFTPRWLMRAVAASRISSRLRSKRLGSAGESMRAGVDVMGR